MPAGWRRHPPRSSSPLLCHRPSGPAEACCGRWVRCCPRSLLRSVLRARRGHVDGVSGGAFTGERAHTFPRRDHAVDSTRWDLRRSACRHVVRGRRRPQNLVRRDTEVCPSPSVTCRCHTPAPSPVPRPTTKSSSVDCTGENFRDRTPPRTVNTRRPAVTEHPRRADTATHLHAECPIELEDHRRREKRAAHPRVKASREASSAWSRRALLCAHPPPQPPPDAIVGVTALAKPNPYPAAVSTSGTRPNFF